MNMSAQPGLKAQPFRIAVPDDVLDRIAARLASARIGYAPEQDGDWRYGTDTRYLAELVRYWTEGYDWRTQEAALNRWPQFRVSIDGIAIHFYHIVPDAARPIPILMTHGWPASVVEFQSAIPHLLAAGYALVIPSLPGFGWSDRPPDPMGSGAIARLWRSLMVQVLGYERFYAQGGDFGSLVSVRLGAEHADVVAAIHLNFFQGPPLGPDADQELRNYWGQVGAFMESEGAYIHQQVTAPQTIGLALHDNPVGWAAWVIEKFHRWGDTGGNIESRFSKDQLITNLMSYIVTDNVSSSMWIYPASAVERDSPPARVAVPTGIAVYPGELYPMPSRALADRQHHIVRWSEMLAGGHFAAMEEPGAFSADVVAFFDGCA